MISSVCWKEVHGKSLFYGPNDICVVFSRFTSKHSKWFSCLYDWWSWTRTTLMSDLTGCVRKEKLGIPRWCGWKEKTIVNCWVIVIFNSLFLDIKCLVIPVTNKVSTQMGLCNKESETTNHENYSNGRFEAAKVIHKKWSCNIPVVDEIWLGAWWWVRNKLWHLLIYMALKWIISKVLWLLSLSKSYEGGKPIRGWIIFP